VSTKARAYIAGILIAVVVLAAGAPRILAARNNERTIAMYNIHTKETISIVYKKNGKYVPEAMKKLNYFMRDWRKNEVITIDPELIDLLWEVHAELGSNEPIHLICGHRSQATNEMLRKTRGGQASKSQHITGKAADVTFPDVPLKQLRYSALIRERGGVGYYPTSGIPFVHMDTARVRAWPRLPRYELASLFPSGHTKHIPTDGRPITKEDVRIARKEHKNVYAQVAEFFSIRGKPRAPATTLVASADNANANKANNSDNVQTPPPPPRQVASLAPTAMPAPPKLVSAPKLIVEHRPKYALGGPMPSESDRAKLNQLATLASFEPEQPRLTSAPQPAHRPETSQRQFAVASLGGTLTPAPAAEARPKPAAPAGNPRLAALSPSDANPRPAETLTDAGRFGWGNGWVQQPDFDEDHPEELAYRPFPIGPLLTPADSDTDAPLAELIHPDVQKTLELIDDEGIVLPMRMRPGEQLAELMWARQFTGQAVDLTAMSRAFAPENKAPGITDRTVATTPR
jgi:uncharacterized protein YcbK (DUF882 family)